MKVLFNTISIYIFCLVLISQGSLGFGLLLNDFNQEEEEVENRSRTETENEVLEFVLSLGEVERKSKKSVLEFRSHFNKDTLTTSNQHRLNIFIYTKQKVPLYISYCCLRTDIA